MHIVCSGLRSVLSLSHFLISCNLLHYIEVADIRLLALGRRIEFSFKEGTGRDKNRNNKRNVGVIHGNGEKKKGKISKDKTTVQTNTNEIQKEIFYLPDDFLKSKGTPRMRGVIESIHHIKNTLTNGKFFPHNYGTYNRLQNVRSRQRN